MSVQSVTDENYKSYVPRSGVTLIDFWGTYCPPCKKLLPVLEEIEGDLAGQVAVLKTNVEDSQQLVSELGIMSTPTVVVYQNGEPVDKLVGLRPKEVYMSTIRRYMS